MEKENLVMLLKYEGKNAIYPVEQITLCLNHYDEKSKTNNNYQINKVVSSMPHMWCEACNLLN